MKIFRDCMVHNLWKSCSSIHPMPAPSMPYVIVVHTQASYNCRRSTPAVVFSVAKDFSYPLEGGSASRQPPAHCKLLKIVIRS